MDRADGPDPEPALVRLLCDRHRGVGSDGILLGDTATRPVGLRIFNPDATEAEKSGNGLRIFAAWLHHRGIIAGEPFPVELPGETVEMQVEDADEHGARLVRVAMGTASFRAGDVGFGDAAADAEVMGGVLRLGDDAVAIHLVSMGNPHCVLFPDDDPTPDALRRLGLALQAHPAFTRGINVQLARVVDPGTLDILIWERGAGETAASGTSACAATAAALRTGRLSGDAFVVRMPGGEVEVRIEPDWAVTLRGEARVVFEGVLTGS